MNVRILHSYEEIDRAAWTRLLEATPERCWFQSPQCYDFLVQQKTVEPFVLGACEDGQLKGVILGYLQRDGRALKAWLSRRAIVNGGPLLADDISKDALFYLLMETRLQLLHRAIYIETRNFKDYHPWRVVFESAAFRLQDHLNFQIATPSEEAAQERLSPGRRRDIHTAFKEGVEIDERPSQERIEAFCEILETLYATRVKTPLFPRTFFRTLARCEDAHYLLVVLDGRVLGGTLCLGRPGGTLYEWFACGLDTENRRCFPSSVATWAGIRYAARNGHPVFDMMGAGSPDKAYGVRKFKEKFGGTLVRHGRYLCIQNRFLYRIGQLGVRILKGEIFGHRKK